MAGWPDMWGTDYGAGMGYAGYDVADAYLDAGDEHTHFVVWLVVFLLAAVAILGGLKVGGFHFVVKA